MNAAKELKALNRNFKRLVKAKRLIQMAREPMIDGADLQFIIYKIDAAKNLLLSRELQLEKEVKLQGKLSIS